MRGNLLVRGGTLVDGTGAPARAADVRIRDGAVVEVAPGLAPDGETVVDADGAYVAPGFIDCHTHYDPSVWWDPLVDPMPQHGVTTVVTGNCSLSLTPVRAADRVAASDVFGFIEDIPVDAFAAGIPWSWESYAEWRDALRAHGTAVHVAPLLGHSNLRVYVMGDEAWNRPARPEERDRMAAVLADSLAAGALGLSTSFIDQDRHGHAVPSRAADDDELRALIEVLGRAPGHAAAALPEWRVPGTSSRRTAATRRAPNASSSRRTCCTPTAVACSRRSRRDRSTSTSASTRPRRSWPCPRGEG